MKKKLIALALIIIVALAAMEGLYLLLRRAHEARQTPAPEMTVERATVEEAKTDIAVPQLVKEEPAEIHFLRDKKKQIEEPVEGSQRFEDLPKELQEKYMNDRNAVIVRTYANRFKMTEEEWNALSKKEQRLLIRKGTKQ